MTGFLRKRCGICKHFAYDLDSDETMINQKCTYKNEKVFNRDDCCEDFEISKYGNHLLVLHDAVLVDNDFSNNENDSTNSGNEKRLTLKEYYDLSAMDIIEIVNEQHEENEKLKLHLHILERVVYMLDNEVARAMEDGFDVSEWYLNYLAKGDDLND